MRYSDRRGFTLVELMVAVVITGVISTALVQILQVGQRSAERNSIVMDMQQNARVGLDALANDLRHISYGKDPTQPSIHRASADTIIFVANLWPENPGAEVVSYFLSGGGDPDSPNPNDTVLMRVIADTAGVVLNSAPQAYGIAAGGLNFRWFNGTGVEMSSPVPQPELVGEILVNLTAVGARKVGGTYPAMSLSSTIYPRNLPLSPARSRPNNPGCQPLILPNCEAATLSWTTPTTNTDGSDLPLVEISHFNFYFGTDPNNQTLYTRLARTINQWTMHGLTGGDTYYLSVTCVSRSGVESYKCTRTADMSSILVPSSVPWLDASAGAPGDLQLTWGTVTTFENGDLITTPVTYRIHRGGGPGFTPDSSTLIASVSYTDSYTDTTLPLCSTGYYQVLAEACGNPGDPSPEVSATVPAVPACASGLAAVADPETQTVTLAWSHPTMRVDGSPFDNSEISGYRVYAGTVPGSLAFHQSVSGAVESALLTGLTNCVTQYLNVTCIDACGNEGDLCPFNETSIFLSMPCGPGAPDAPPVLDLVAMNNQMNLQWPANTVDCDLEGYYIYYGPYSGPPYTGNDANEGPSPIWVDATSVTFGTSCNFSLTGLGSCQQYYIAVSAADACSPRNESVPSPEASDLTSCSPCLIDAGCVAWAVNGGGNERLHLEIFSGNAGGETLTRLKADYTGSALISEVWYGRPLARIWSADGSAGEDGPWSPQPSGVLLNVDDVLVPSWTSESDGEPLAVIFTEDIRGRNVDITFRSFSGQCTASGSGEGALVVDNFDNGAYTGWSAVSGSWSASTGELVQSAETGNHLIRNSGVNLGDLTLESKVYIDGGAYLSPYLAFRIQDDSNYYVFGLRGGQNRVRIAKIVNGAWAGELVWAPFTVSTGIWYNLRVVANGTRIRGYVDCNLVLDVNDGTWSSGGLGLTTRAASGRFDDVKIFPAAVLP